MGGQICKVTEVKTGEQSNVRILRKPINEEVKERYENYKKSFERLISLVAIIFKL